MAYSVRMNPMELTAADAVLERQLDILDQAGALDKVARLLFGKPRSVERDEWLCAYRIIGVDGLLDETYEIYGIDGVQALENATVAACGLLMGSDAFKQRRLMCNGRIYPVRKWYAIVEYGCEVAGKPSDSRDIQVKYYELETEEEVVKAITSEARHTYPNISGEPVSWQFRRILMIRENPNFHHGAELIGYVSGA
jgi:hypothetical protein